MRMTQRTQVTLTLRQATVTALDAAAEMAVRSRSGLADLLIARGLEGLELAPVTCPRPDAPEARVAA